MKRKYERRQQRNRIIAGIVAGILVLLLALGALAPLMRGGGTRAEAVIHSLGAEITRAF